MTYFTALNTAVINASSIALYIFAACAVITALLETFQHKYYTVKRDEAYASLLRGLGFGLISAFIISCVFFGIMIPVLGFYLLAMFAMVAIIPSLCLGVVIIDRIING